MNLRRLAFMCSVCIITILSSCKYNLQTELETPVSERPDTLVQVSEHDSLIIETDAWYLIDFFPGPDAEEPFCILLILIVENRSSQDIEDFGLDKIALFDYAENYHLKTFDVIPSHNTHTANLIPARSSVELNFAAERWKHKSDMHGKKVYCKARIGFSGLEDIIIGPSRTVGAIY